MVAVILAQVSSPKRGRTSRWAKLTVHASLGVVGVLALAIAVILTVPVTSAALADRANVNMTKVEIPHFGVGVVGQDGLVAAATEESPLALRFDGGSELIPGDTVTASLTVFNNSERLGNNVRLSIAPVGDGSVNVGGGARPNITKFLLITITDEGGNLLLKDARPTSGKIIDLSLDPRDAAELKNGDVFTGGASGSTTKLTIDIHYEDDPRTTDYVTGRSSLGLTLQATSTAP